MAKSEWETPIPEEEKEHYLEIARMKFCDKEISKYIADESYLADKWAIRAAESMELAKTKRTEKNLEELDVNLDKELFVIFDRFRGYQQQHNDRALELQKIIVERETAHAVQCTGNIIAVFSVLIALAQLKPIFPWIFSWLGN